MAESDDLVPFFSSPRRQIGFEFLYLLAMLVCGVALLVAVHLQLLPIALSDGTRQLIYAAGGGLLGGWSFGAKWFYRVTARGKGNQYKEKWECHKFYWRILAPLVAGMVAFASFLLISTKILPLSLPMSTSGRSTFAICFILGHFSDMMLSRVACWLESMVCCVLPS